MFTSFVLKTLTCIYTRFAEKLWSSETIQFNYPKFFSNESLISAQESFIPTDFANLNPDCSPNKVFHRYPHLSKEFDNPLNDKALKLYFFWLQNTILIMNYSFRMHNQQVSFQKAVLAIIHKLIFNMHLMLKLPNLEKLLKVWFLKLKLSMINQLIFKKGLTSTDNLQNYLNLT